MKSSVGLFILLLSGSVTANAGSLSRLTPHASRTTHHASRQDDVRDLVLGAPVERELAGGQTHVYRVTVAAGQYLNVVVDQRGIDVVVRLFGPDNKELAKVDREYEFGPEPVFILAESPGAYRCEVSAVEKEAGAGQYEVRLEALRAPTPEDQHRLTAARLTTEAIQLRGQGTAEALRKAVAKYEESRPLWQAAGDPPWEANALQYAGLFSLQLGDRQKALQYFTRALPLQRAVGSRFGEAYTLHNLAYAYWLMGESQKALEHYHQALSGKQAMGDRRGAGLTLNDIGSVHNSLGEFQPALDYYTQALHTGQAMRDKRLESSALNNLATVYTALGEYQWALDRQTQALAIARALGSRRDEAARLTNIGTTYRLLGELQTALEYYQQALPLNRAVGDRAREAATIDLIGSVLDALGETQKALDYHQQSLTIRRAVSDRRGEALALSNIGQAYHHLGDLPKALDHYQQSLDLFRAVGDRYSEAAALHRLGRASFSQGEKQKALDYYGPALALRQSIGDRQGELQTLCGLAQAEADRGRLTEARTHTEAALAIIETLRAKVSSQDLRASFLASNQYAYELLINLLAQQHQQQPSAGHDVIAFHASERARARSLLDLLAEARINIEQGVDPALKQRETTTYARISWLQSQLIQANSRPSPDKNRIAQLEEDLKKVEGERAQLEIEIKQKHPRYAELQYPTPLGLKAIQGLLDESTALLEYTVGKDRSFLFVVTRTNYQVAELPAAASLSERVMRLREALIMKPQRTTFSTYLEQARALHQTLIGPAQKGLAGKQHLIIVPDGVLHYLPFEVLLSSGDERGLLPRGPRQWPYLVRDYTISYTPSASALASLRRLRQSKPAPPKTFLAYADPAYGATEPAEAGPVRSAVRSAFGEDKPWKLDRLPQSREEVNHIAALYPQDQVRVFLQQDAREENVKAEAQLSQYRFVHFAAHGLLNENKPQYSGLVLTLPVEEDPRPKTQDSRPQTADQDNPKSEIRNPKSAEDGLLQVYEIFNLRLNADLVVLSACETGLGKEVKGEGLIGLTRAFLYAGTPSVVVSLWKVLDTSTADLMVRLYRNMKGGDRSKAQALQQAQLEMVRQGRYAHPHYWAPFILVGEPK
jgi:CHAT domain-containing protein